MTALVEWRNNITFEEHAAAERTEEVYLGMCGHSLREEFEGNDLI
jgi:hypothetical protein